MPRSHLAEKFGAGISRHINNLLLMEAYSMADILNSKIVYCVSFKLII